MCCVDGVSVCVGRGIRGSGRCREGREGNLLLFFREVALSRLGPRAGGAKKNTEIRDDYSTTHWDNESLRRQYHRSRLPRPALQDGNTQL